MPPKIPATPGKIAQDGVHACPTLAQYASQVCVVGAGAKQGPRVPFTTGGAPRMIRLSHDAGGVAIGQP
jgi:hypothetical protein